MWFLLQYLAFSVANHPVWLVFRRQAIEMEEMIEFFCKKREKTFIHVILFENHYRAAQHCRII